jgi:hypothetical protein
VIIIIARISRSNEKTFGKYKNQLTVDGVFEKVFSGRLRSGGPPGRTPGTYQGLPHHSSAFRFFVFLSSLFFGTALYSSTT